VVEAGTLDGAWTSTMLALTTASGDRAVLRLMTNEPWRTYGAELTTRERATLVMLADTDVPAPHSIALDADGSQTGEAAHLMTLLPGKVDLDRTSDTGLQTIAWGPAWLDVAHCSTHLALWHAARSSATPAS
jgi:aminoglycoside phosphotransferase (APT) family kinase protein